MAHDTQLHYSNIFFGNDSDVYIMISITQVS